MSDARSQHRAKKSLGQNFLNDPNICRKIVDALVPDKADYNGFGGLFR